MWQNQAAYLQCREGSFLPSINTDHAPVTLKAALQLLSVPPPHPFVCKAPSMQLHTLDYLGRVGDQGFGKVELNAFAFMLHIQKTRPT